MRNSKRYDVTSGYAPKDSKWTPCYFCGDRAPYTPCQDRFCNNEYGAQTSLASDAGVAKPTCGIALSKREPLLIDAGSASAVRLHFDGFPDSGMVAIGHLQRPASPDELFNYVDVGPHDSENLVLERHALINLHDGRYLLSRASEEAFVMLNEEEFDGEVELSPMCRIKIGPKLLFYFLP